MNVGEVLLNAREKGYAIGAFNAGNLETIKAIVAAAQALRSPIIIEVSHGEASYIGSKNLLDIIANERMRTGLPIFSNLDHAPTLEDALEGVELGFNLVHFDGSDEEFSENVVNTTHVVTAAHRHGILVEAEIDKIQGSSAPHPAEDVTIAQRAGTYTDPDQAEQFVSATGVDTLASFVGNVHGVFKTAPQLDLDRLRRIAQKVPCFLSLHGGSGIAADQIRGAIDAGIVKINVNSELRIAYRQALERSLVESDEVAIYKIMPPVIAAVQKVVEKKIRLFGSAGKAK